MKKATACLAALLLIAASGCGKAQTAGQPEELPSVYVSIYPLYDFALKVAGDKAAVVLLAGGGEPHEWEPSPSDRTGLEKADVFVYNGLGMEHWVDTVLDALENEPLVVEASSVVEPLDSGQEEQDGHGHGTQDPHTWLSPRNAIKQVEAIKDALAQADPDNAAFYQENCDRYAEELRQLDKEYTTTLTPLPSKKIVVAHQAFGYLCRDYGLEQAAVRGYSPDSEPDLASMANIIAYAGEHGVKVIFFEQDTSPQIAEAIAREVGARTDILNPIEFLTQQEAADGADYLSLMRENLAALKRALE